MRGTARASRRGAIASSVHRGAFIPTFVQADIPWSGTHSQAAAVAIGVDGNNQVAAYMDLTETAVQLTVGGVQSYQAVTGVGCPSGGTLELVRSAPHVYDVYVNGVLRSSWTDSGHIADPVLGPFVSVIAAASTNAFCPTIDNFTSDHFSDNFNRANGAVGNGWTGIHAAIVSNAVANDGTAGGFAAITRPST